MWIWKSSISGCQQPTGFRLNFASLQTCLRNEKIPRHRCCGRWEGVCALPLAHSALNEPGDRKRLSADWQVKWWPEHGAKNRALVAKDIVVLYSRWVQYVGELFKLELEKKTGGCLAWSTAMSRFPPGYFLGKRRKTDSSEKKSWEALTLLPQTVKGKIKNLWRVSCLLFLVCTSLKLSCA